MKVKLEFVRIKTRWHRVANDGRSTICGNHDLSIILNRPNSMTLLSYDNPLPMCVTCLQEIQRGLPDAKESEFLNGIALK